MGATQFFQNRILEKLFGALILRFNFRGHNKYLSKDNKVNPERSFFQLFSMSRFGSNFLQYPLVNLFIHGKDFGNIKLLGPFQGILLESGQVILVEYK